MPPRRKETAAGPDARRFRPLKAPSARAEGAFLSPASRPDAFPALPSRATFSTPSRRPFRPSAAGLDKRMEKDYISSLSLFTKATNTMNSQTVLSGRLITPARGTRRHAVRPGALRARLCAHKAERTQAPAPGISEAFRPKKAKWPAHAEGSTVSSAVPTEGSLPAGDMAALFRSPSRSASVRRSTPQHRPGRHFS